MPELRNETKVGLLMALKDFTEETVKGLLLPVKRQKQDEREPPARPAAVYLARLPDMSSFDRKAPFILHQVVTGADAIGNAAKGSGREQRPELQSEAVIRTVFCVYDRDEQEGALALLNLMELLRVELLSYPILGQLFTLDLREGIDQMIYPETGERGTAPFYLGEMVTTWELPPVTRQDAALLIQGKRADGRSNAGLGGRIPMTDPNI